MLQQPWNLCPNPVLCLGELTTDDPMLTFLVVSNTAYLLLKSEPSVQVLFCVNICSKSFTLNASVEMHIEQFLVLWYYGIYTNTYQSFDAYYRLHYNNCDILSEIYSFEQARSQGMHVHPQYECRVLLLRRGLWPKAMLDRAETPFAENPIELSKNCLMRRQLLLETRSMDSAEQTRWLTKEAKRDG